MRKSLFCLLLLAPFFAFGQQHIGKVETLVNNTKRDNISFKEISIFNRSKDNQTLRNDIPGSDAVLLTMDTEKLKNIHTSAPEAMSINVPFHSHVATVELVKVNIFSDDFKAHTSDGKDITNSMDRGVHYRGIIRGQSGTLVSLSFFENEILGFIADAEQNFTLGKMKDDSENYILYKETDIEGDQIFKCETKDDGIIYKEHQLTFRPSNLRNMTTLDIYIEAGSTVYNSFSGNLTNTTNFLNGVFAQSYSIFDNDGIMMVTSELFIWTTTDPYNSGNSSGQLALFQGNTSSINGDIGHLVEVQNIGGVAAGFNGLCNPEVDSKLCFSGFSGNAFQTYPVFSFNTYIITHEMGHLFGSRHTHACVWNGNGTAIDGCSGFVEGNCGLPPSPVGGGTIMSYCSNNPVGVNFTLGFGPQPAAVMNNIINDGNCCPNGAQIFSSKLNAVCTGDNVSYEVVVSGGNGIHTYQWCAYDSPDGTGPCLSDFAPSATAEFPSRIWNSVSGTKSVLVTVSQAGCPDLVSDLHSFDIISNDDVCDALLINIGETVGANSECATAQVGEVRPPLSSCTAQTGWCETVVHNSLWYYFVAPNSGVVDIFINNRFDAQLALWTLTDCNDFGTFVLVAANDDRSSNNFSPFINDVCVTPGQTYYIQIDGFNGVNYNTGLTVDVVTNTPLAITCPLDVNVGCLGASIDPLFTGTAIANDNTCCATPAVITYDDVDDNEGEIVRTWTATYSCGVVLTCDQIITYTPFVTINNGPYDVSTTWTDGCTPPNPIPGGTTVMMLHDVSIGMNMELTNNGLIKLMNNMSLTNFGTCKGTGVFEGNFINNGIFRPGN